MPEPLVPRVMLLMKLITVVCLVLALSAASAYIPLARAAVINVPAQFATIQAAINAAAPGDTINVAAGTYTELITVNKANLILTATGAATIQDPAGGFALVTITSNGVTINGFTIHSTATMDFTVRVSADSVTLNNVILQHDRANQGAAVTLDPGISGFTMSGGSITSQRNGISGGVFGSTLTNIKITGVTFNVLGGDFSILLFGAIGSQVSGNTFNTNTVLLAHIRVSTLSNNLVIVGNTIRGPTAGAVGHGIRLLTAGTVTISGNTITGANVGVFINPGGGAPNAHINFNNIVGNPGPTGIRNDDTNSIDAENNWWGCSAGPGNPGCDTVTGPVDFTPFKTSEIPAPVPPNTPVGLPIAAGTMLFTNNAGSLSGVQTSPTTPSGGALAAGGAGGLTFPFGFFVFTIAPVPVGGSATVTVTIPTPIPSGFLVSEAVWVKCRGGTCVVITPIARTTTSITFVLTDGGVGDDDGVANGVIVDQGGPGFNPNPGIPEYPIEPMIALVGALAGFFLVRRRIR